MKLVDNKKYINANVLDVMQALKMFNSITGVTISFLHLINLTLRFKIAVKNGNKNRLIAYPV